MPNFIVQNFQSLTNQYGESMQLISYFRTITDPKIGKKSVEYKTHIIEKAILIFTKHTEKLVNEARLQVFDASIIYFSEKVIKPNLNDFVFIRGQWYKIGKIEFDATGCYQLQVNIALLETVPREIIACVSSTLTVGQGVV